MEEAVVRRLARMWIPTTRQEGGTRLNEKFTQHETPTSLSHATYALTPLTGDSQHFSYRENDTSSYVLPMHTTYFSFIFILVLFRQSRRR